MEAPMLLEAPVTTATLPLSLFMGDACLPAAEHCVHLEPQARNSRFGAARVLQRRQIDRRVIRCGLDRKGNPAEFVIG